MRFSISSAPNGRNEFLVSGLVANANRSTRRSRIISEPIRALLLATAYQQRSSQHDPADDSGGRSRNGMQHASASLQPRKDLPAPGRRIGLYVEPSIRSLEYEPLRRPLLIVPLIIPHWC